MKSTPQASFFDLGLHFCIRGAQSLGKIGWKYAVYTKRDVFQICSLHVHKYCVVMVARALIIAGRQQLHFVEVYVEFECLITLFLSGVFPQTKKHCTVNEG